MKPCARLSGLCGLAALVATVVAISCLATHASAIDGDPCAGINCGSSASCMVQADGTADCWCEDGTAFNKTDKTCYCTMSSGDENACSKVDCGPSASCVQESDPNSPPECVCNDNKAFNKEDKTCYDACVVSGKECGSDASCVAYRNYDPECQCNKAGMIFNEPAKACFGPLVRTAVQLSGRSIKDQLTFATSVPAEQASGTTVCASSDLSYSIGGAQITVVWDAPKLRSSDPLRPEALGSGMCKSVTFFSSRGCTGQPGLTIARPAKKGRSYPATKRPVKAMYSPQSVGCNLTTCHKDCGAAECVVKEGQQQCQCSDGLVFNAAKKTCRDPFPAPKCKPACTAGAQCMFVAGKTVYEFPG